VDSSDQSVIGDEGRSVDTVVCHQDSPYGYSPLICAPTHPDALLNVLVLADGPKPSNPRLGNKLHRNKTLPSR
jgi:hypothetical protein